MQLVRHLCILGFHQSCICRNCRFCYNNSRGGLDISTLICAPNSEVNGGNKRTSKAFGSLFSLHAVQRRLRDRRKRRKHIRPRGLLQSLIRRPLPPLYLLIFLHTTDKRYGNQALHATLNIGVQQCKDKR